MFLIYCSTPVWAINVLQENATLRKELNSLSTQQQKENLKNIRYYNGRSSYCGIDRTQYSSSKYSFSQKNIYTKKGVKFKIDKDKQEQRLKEAQDLTQQVEKEIQEKQQTQIVEIKENKNEQKTNKPSHNQDAE